MPFHGHIRFLNIMGCLAFCSLAQAPIPASAAEIKGIAQLCEEKKQICFWHKTAAAPPKGWIEDEDWTQRYEAMVMFENGDKSKSKPVMYVRTHNGDAKLDLDSYIRTAQENWKQRVPDSSIEALPDFEREGKPGFKVFLYKNPTTPEQTFELTAFMKDVDSEHPDQTYFFQIVLSSSNRKVLERAKPAFYELLGKL
jgi:hypothetical protein